MAKNRAKIWQDSYKWQFKTYFFYCSVYQKEATHNPNANERISFERALAAYSLMGADYEHETGHNPNRGRITEGASADIVVINRGTLNKMLAGEGSPEEFAKMGAESAVMNDKVAELEAGINKVYRQGRLVKEKK